MTVAGALAAPFVEQLGMMAALGASGGGGLYFMKWAFEMATKRVAQREERVDGNTNKLLDGTLSWANDMQEWARNVQSQLADCMEHHAECREELASVRAMVAAHGEVRQQAQLVSAANELSRLKSEQRAAERSKNDPAG